MVKRLLGIVIILFGFTKYDTLYQYNFAPGELTSEALCTESGKLNNKQMLENQLHILSVTNLYRKEEIILKYLNEKRETCGNSSVTKAVVKEDKMEQNRWNIKLTDTEINLLAKIVWIESRGENDKGQQAVIETILNRMVHWDFKGTLYEVLSAKNQFSSWKSRNTAEPTKKEYRNIRKVLNGETNILDKNTVYFSTSPRNSKITAHIGRHYFCKYELVLKK